jgi:hypothetical protein
MVRGLKRYGRAVTAVASGVGFLGGNHVCLTALRAALCTARQNKQGVEALGFLAPSLRSAAAGDVRGTRSVANKGAVGREPAANLR